MSFKSQDEKNLIYHENFEVKVLERRERALQVEVLENPPYTLWLPYTEKTKKNFLVKGQLRFVNKDYIKWVQSNNKKGKK